MSEVSLYHLWRYATTRPPLGPYMVQMWYEETLRQRGDNVLSHLLDRERLGFRV